MANEDNTNVKPVQRLKQIARDLTDLKAQLHRSQIETITVHIKVLALVEDLLIRHGESPKVFEMYRTLLGELLQRKDWSITSNSTETSKAETSDSAQRLTELFNKRNQDELFNRRDQDE